jgi:hypothetical protein
MATLRLLHVGDIVGDPGLHTLYHLLPSLKEERQVDFCVVNGENSHQGRGLNERQVKKMYKAGADVITGGDHSFDKHLIFPYMKKDAHLLRPMNYPPGVPGRGYGIYTAVSAGVQVGVVNIRGQALFHNPIRCPFAAMKHALSELTPYTNLIFVDFHAEATAEKMAMAWFLDGSVSALSCTHTHVQTGDEQIFPQGMGYLTDVGFTGAHTSVIGMDINTAIERFRLQIPRKYQPATQGLQLHGILFDIDLATGKTVHLERLHQDCPDEVLPQQAQQQEDEAATLPEDSEAGSENVPYKDYDENGASSY